MYFMKVILLECETKVFTCVFKSVTIMFKNYFLVGNTPKSQRSVFATDESWVCAIVEYSWFSPHNYSPIFSKIFVKPAPYFNSGLAETRMSEII